MDATTQADLATTHLQAAVLVKAAAELVRQATITLSGTAWSGMLSDAASDLHVTASRVADYDPTGD